MCAVILYECLIRICSHTIQFPICQSSCCEGDKKEGEIVGHSNKCTYFGGNHFPVANLLNSITELLLRQYSRTVYFVISPINGSILHIRMLVGCKMVMVIVAEGRRRLAIWSILDNDVARDYTNWIPFIRKYGALAMNILFGLENPWSWNIPR